MSIMVSHMRIAESVLYVILKSYLSAPLKLKYLHFDEISTLDTPKVVRLKTSAAASDKKCQNDVISVSVMGKEKPPI